MTRTSRDGWRVFAGTTRSAGPRVRARPGSPAESLARLSSFALLQQVFEGQVQIAVERDADPAADGCAPGSSWPPRRSRTASGPRRPRRVDSVDEEVTERDRGIDVGRRRVPAPRAATPRRRLPRACRPWTHRARVSRRTRAPSTPGSAPTKESTILPSSIAKTAGIDCTLKAWAICGFASTSTLASSTAPPVSSTTFSMIGPSVLHGPHHSAQRSTTTGTVIDRSITAVANVASVTSVTSVSITVRFASEGVTKHC